MISSKARDVLLELASNIAGKKKEHLFVVDAKNGKVVAHFVGDAKRVEKSTKVMKMLAQNGQGYAVLHNHPGGKAPSARDVINALRSAYAEGWVVVPSGEIWVYSGLTKDRVSKKTAGSVRKYKDLAKGTAMRLMKRRTGKRFADFDAAEKAALKSTTSKLMMRFLKNGVQLPPLLKYQVVRANPCRPCFGCASGYCEARVRSNPARDDNSVYEALALIAKRNGADMVGRTMVALDDQEGKKLWLTYEPNKSRRIEGADGPFLIHAMDWNPDTMKQAKMQRDVFAENIDDAEAIFKHFRQRLWPQRGYAKRRIEEIGRQ